MGDGSGGTGHISLTPVVKGSIDGKPATNLLAAFSLLRRQSSQLMYPATSSEGDDRENACNFDPGADLRKYIKVAIEPQLCLHSGLHHGSGHYHTGTGIIVRRDG